jgi:hypothetical protein
VPRVARAACAVFKDLAGSIDEQEGKALHHQPTRTGVVKLLILKPFMTIVASEPSRGGAPMMWINGVLTWINNRGRQAAPGTT